MAGGPYRFVSYERQMNTGVVGALLVNISAVAKPNTPMLPYSIANELICGTLGRLIGLPVPPCAIVDARGMKGRDDQLFFVSLDCNLTGVSLPPVVANDVVRIFPDVSTGILLFDIWIANCDRNTANLSADLLAKPPAINVFDHSHALLGFHPGRGEERLKYHRDGLGISWSPKDSFISGQSRHCLLDAIQTDGCFGNWIERIGKIPDYMIQDSCQAAKGLGIGTAEADAALEFLKFRRDNLSNLIERHRAEFKGIANWSLFT